MYARRWKAPENSVAPVHSTISTNDVLILQASSRITPPAFIVLELHSGAILHVERSGECTTNRFSILADIVGEFKNDAHFRLNFAESQA